MMHVMILDKEIIDYNNRLSNFWGCNSIHQLIVKVNELWNQIIIFCNTKHTHKEKLKYLR